MPKSSPDGHGQSAKSDKMPAVSAEANLNQMLFRDLGVPSS
jgi:hypothetical protein